MLTIVHIVSAIAFAAAVTSVLCLIDYHRLSLARIQELKDEVDSLNRRLAKIRKHASDEPFET